METVIVICLLIVIVLLLQDKIVINDRSEHKSKQEKVNPNLPDIMGQPKPVERLSVPNTATKRQIEETGINPANLDIEYDKNENVGISIAIKDFVNSISTMPSRKESLSPFSNLADELETILLGGKIEMNQDGSINFINQD